ncbi:PTS galactitol transporter subunit IIA [Pasteurella oralis]|uniref:PTS galactitol transporter subunit IIA n=1 Tax=Pasteurella oralis TaxID=1071947 RepID=A0ABW4NX76_9PAST|nr:PTS galactitol transporter subunit IIA [Pasteurella oralis]MDO5055607.1 PTS galactitol transporter subunit IIA [Pasteurella oralis]
MTTKLFINTNIEFMGTDDALNHLADTFIAQGIVKESYRKAIFERELEFPTGIALEQHAVAIPHCDAEHALQPAIYFIRPVKTVKFNRPDEDGTVDAELIIALVVTDPREQLTLLRNLFGKLQHAEFIETLIKSSKQDLLSIIKENFLL